LGWRRIAVLSSRRCPALAQVLDQRGKGRVLHGFLQAGQRAHDRHAGLEQVYIWRLNSSKSIWVTGSPVNSV